MRSDNHQGTCDRANPGAEIDVKDCAWGWQGAPPQEGVSAVPDDLDALCVLFDERRCVLEVIHPGHPRNANGSVIHTGDSQTGAGEWDDERIFIFLEALPEAVSAFAFIVASFTARTFSDIRGASCHVSDCVTERELIRLELSALEGQTACCVAALHRSPDGWQISTDAQAVDGGLMAELLSGVRSLKSRLQPR